MYIDQNNLESFADVIYREQSSPSIASIRKSPAQLNFYVEKLNLKKLNLFVEKLNLYVERCGITSAAN